MKFDETLVNVTALIKLSCIIYYVYVRLDEFE